MLKLDLKQCNCGGTCIQVYVDELTDGSPLAVECLDCGKRLGGYKTEANAKRAWSAVNRRPKARKR